MNRQLAAFFFATGLGASMLGAQEPETRAAPAPYLESDAMIWGGVVFGSAHADASITTVDDPDFLNISNRLAKVFPQKNFSLMGQHTQSIHRQYESWVVPSDDLFLKIDSKGPTKNGGVQLHIQLWLDEKVIVKTDAVLRPDSPLFIGGPPWRSGRLIIVVMLTTNGRPA